jgi:hypothetical protein
MMLDDDVMSVVSTTSLQADMADAQSALRTPRSVTKVTFDEPKKPSTTPLKSAAPTVGTLVEKLSALHDMVLASDHAPLVKKSCHVHLFDADRAIAQWQLRHKSKGTARGGKAGSTATTPRDSARRGSTAGGTPRAALVSNASFSSNLSASSPKRHADPGAAQETASSPGSDFGGVSKAERLERQERSWSRFLKCVTGQLSPEEVELLSLSTVKRLMKHYGLDRDPVDTANIELYWRTLAQRREDERNTKAIMHKNCAAASNPKKAAAGRDISATFNKRSDQRR